MRSVFNDAVFKKVKQALERTSRLDTEGLSGTTRLREDLRFGRIARLKLALSLEEIFDHELPDDVVDGFATLADIVRYFSRRYFRDVAPALIPLDQAA